MGFKGRIVALVVAAGSGSRLGGTLPKQYRDIAGRPVLTHALERLRHPRIDAVCVVIGPGQEELYRGAAGTLSLLPPVIGGASRRESVRNGLEALADAEFDVVLIHDAARPFVPADLIDRLVDALGTHAAAVPVLPVTDTIVRAENLLGESIDRGGLARVQTPQAFRFGAILQAHRAWSGALEATDDAQVARAAGVEVAAIDGDSAAEKLTYPGDFHRAERFVGARMVGRTGQGFDVHAFCDGDHLWLGGVRVAHDRGLAGHSDADVVLHAVTDSLLGAIGAGDIGEHFPPSDPRWRGAASGAFVDHARALIEGRGGRIDHVDVTVICEQPRLGPHKDAMRRAIADLLRIPAARVSVKATTTEGLGFTGRGEGIAAQALASVRLWEEP